MAKDETIVVELPHEFPGLAETLPYAQEMIDHFTGAHTLDLHCLLFDAHRVAGFVLGQVARHPTPAPAPVPPVATASADERVALLRTLTALKHSQGETGLVGIEIPWYQILQVVWQIVREVADRLLGS